MSRKQVILSTICIILVMLPIQIKANQEQDVFPQSPPEQKWRIGYYEGGEYPEYLAILQATVQELMRYGWIVESSLPQAQTTRELWAWLANNTHSDFLEFVAEEYYTANWSEERREQVSHKIIQHLNETHNINLMVAMGTWAGQDLANNRHHTPTVVLGVSDALAAGIVKNTNNSGYDHIHARIDPNRFDMQIRIFHETVNFQRLGVAFKNTLEGKSYAALNQIKKHAKRSDFEIVKCFIEESDLTTEEENIKQCFRNFHEAGVDAIYVTQHRSVNRRTIPELVELANAYKIPTFSQFGSEEVKYGFLMSISLSDYKFVGQFHAETIGKIFNGASPNDIKMLFEDPPKIAINLETADKIGFELPIDILGPANEIYEQITFPQE